MVKERKFNLELFFAALADRTRLRLLNLMGEDELCVCFFAEVIGTNQPKISRHLAYLKRAGLVSARRDGKWMHYRITPPPSKAAAEVFTKIREMIREDEEMQADRRNLMTVCCAPVPQQPISIQGAPRPKKIGEPAAFSGHDDYIHI